MIQVCNGPGWVDVTGPMNPNFSGSLGTIVDHLDVAGASPLGAAPTTSSFST